MNMKKCVKCGNNLPATPEFFHRHKGKRDGFSCYCKQCRGYKYKKILIMRDGFKNCSICGRELPATTEFFPAANTKKCGIRPECRECSREYARKYHAANKQARKEYSLKYRTENADVIKQRYDKYRQNNRDKLVARQQKRDARKARLASTYTEEQWDICKAVFKYSCAYCGGKPKKLTPMQKAAAKAMAKKAGRPYPNLVDNMRAAKK